MIDDVAWGQNLRLFHCVQRDISRPWTDNLGMTWIIALAFLAIIASLVVALIIMMRPSAATPPTDEHGNPINGADKPKGNMARALAFRVGFSVLLFIFVLISYWMDWIQPTGITNGQ